MPLPLGKGHFPSYECEFLNPAKLLISIGLANQESMKTGKIDVSM